MMDEVTIRVAIGGMTTVGVAWALAWMYVRSEQYSRDKYETTLRSWDNQLYKVEYREPEKDNG